jgi:uncharacterized membrane protein
VSEPRLHQTIEAVLALGLLASAALLACGLLLPDESVLRAGVLLLMLTPAARVVVLSVGLLLERDWLFGSISLWILGVLLGSLVLALRA